MFEHQARRLNRALEEDELQQEAERRISRRNAVTGPASPGLVQPFRE